MAHGRGPWVLGGIGVALGLVLALWGGGLWDSFGWGAPSDARSASDADDLTAFEADLMQELRERATLRGMPAMHSEARGTGVLTGAVALYVPGAEPKPLPGVTVNVAAIDGAETAFALETGADGRFERVGVKAVPGYAVFIRHAPFKPKVLRGIGVRADHVTDLGTIVLGAPTALTGTVRDAKGRIPVGAKVQVFRDRSRPDSFDLQRGLFELQAAVDAVASTVVAGDGSFLLRDLPPGRYFLRVSAAGYATAFRYGVYVSLDERSTTPRITLDPGAGYYGTVLDAQGRGVANARVIAVAVPGGRARRIDRVDRVTQANGGYRLDTLVPGVRYFIEVWAEGFAPRGQFLAVEGGIEKRDFELVRSGRIEGRVTDEDSGGGIADVEVVIVSGGMSALSPVSTVSDDDGFYVLPHVNPGPVILFSAKAAGYQQGHALDLRSVKSLTIVAGETTRVDWSLRPGGSVRGRVTTRDGQPAPYVTIALNDRKQSWAGERTALTDERGEYAIGGLHPATYEVRVTAPGYAPPTEDAEATVVVGPTLAEVTKDIVLERGGTVFGLVTAPDGTPVGGARVHVDAIDGGRVAERVRDLIAVSNATGAYRIQGVPPRVPVQIVAEHDAYVRAVSAPQRLGPGEENRLALALRPGVRLAGRVEDERGAAVADARVRWGHVEASEAGRLRDSFRADELLGQRVLRTDAAGGFVIDRLEPGLTLVKVEREGYADWYRKDLRIGEAGDQPTLSVTLTGALTIRGRVVDEVTGRAVAEAFVYARERKPVEGEDEDPGRVKALVSTQTAADGTYVLESVPPGRHEVVVWFATGYVAAAQDWRHPGVRRQDVGAGAQGIDFALVRAPLEGG